MPPVPEKPVCTCLSRPSVFNDRVRTIVVIDPYCQLPTHRYRGTYKGPEPTYEKQEGKSAGTSD